MGCTQSKAKEPQRADEIDTAQGAGNETPKGSNVVGQSNQNEEGKTDNKDSAETSTPVVRKELDVKPPPVKAIPKIAPKSIPKKSA